MELKRQVFTIILTLFLTDGIKWTQAGLLDAFGTIVGGLVNPDEKVDTEDDTGFSRNEGRGFDRARGWRNPTNQYDSRQQTSFPSQDNTPSFQKPSHIDLVSRYQNQQFSNSPSHGDSDSSSTDGRNPKYFPKSVFMQKLGQIRENRTASLDETAKLKNDERVTTAISTEKPELKVLKPLTKKKFYFQVQPVVPENERTDISETIYYVD